MLPTLLTNLERLSKLKAFMDILEIKFLSNEAILNKIELAKKSLDKALIYLTFDLYQKINQQAKTNKELAKINFANELKNAYENLGDIQDSSLNKSLEEAILFAEAYRVSAFELLKSDDNLREKLADKLLPIMSERFG